jgi:hypothetical protein
MGEMMIDLPDGAEVSQLRITEVLYSPNVGYTLVSIRQLNDCGFTITFGGGKCKIMAPDGTRVGEFPKVRQGLYRVTLSSTETDLGDGDEIPKVGVVGVIGVVGDRGS